VGGGQTKFSLAGKTSVNSASLHSGSTPTVTSLGGKTGTAVVWICDLTAGLRAFKAVPKDGILTQISLPTTGGCNKFQRPAFGDGTVYFSDINGVVYGLGH
jgi:iron transport multicopper oxidase